MAEETLQCPSCNQKVRAPQELLGQPVQCPLCRQIFTAPVRSSSTPGTPPVVMPAPPAPPGGPLPPQYAPYPGYAQSGYGRPAAPDRDAALALVRGPALAMLIFGIVGLIMNTLGTVMVARMMYSGPEAMIDSLERSLPPGPFLAAMKESFSPEGLVQSLTLHVIFLILCVIICQGAVQMMRLRSFGMAVAASVLSLVNFQNCCCLFGAPAGFWSLLVLFQPAVRNSFE